MQGRLYHVAIAQRSPRPPVYHIRESTHMPTPEIPIQAFWKSIAHVGDTIEQGTESNVLIGKPQMQVIRSPRVLRLFHRDLVVSIRLHVTIRSEEHTSELQSLMRI